MPWSILPTKVSVLGSTFGACCSPTTMFEIFSTIPDILLGLAIRIEVVSIGDNPVEQCLSLENTTLSRQAAPRRKRFRACDSPELTELPRHNVLLPFRHSSSRVSSLRSSTCQHMACWLGRVCPVQLVVFLMSVCVRTRRPCTRITEMALSLECAAYAGRCLGVWPERQCRRSSTSPPR